jgi:EmrB/QacA subfamily drug resistance transporter
MADAAQGAPISLPRRRAITAGLLLGMSLGALEATVVGTAMPTVIATLGGLAHYSWVFSAYLLTSTASVPIWGRLSDLYGRRRMYLLGVTVFLAGSVLSGMATTMVQLIAARALQGLGAGAIIPLSMTIIGELYTLAERARTQAVFSGVWGVASIAGPLVGGYITDALSWRWVFYINLPFGLLCLIVIALAYPPRRSTARVQVDWAGAALMFSGVSSLLLALGGETGNAMAWLVAAVVLLGGFVLVERRVPEPILPLDLFRVPLIARTNVVAFLFGAAMFGAIAFIPLYLQGVLGATATQAGQVLTPLFLGWVTTSIIAARLTVKLGYRPIALAGSVLLASGFAGLSLLTPDSSRTQLLLSCLLMGLGMGSSMLSLLLAVQHGVDRSRLGIATSLNQFSRSIGASVGVAFMGALLARALTGVQLPGGAALGAATVALTGPLRLQFAAALHDVFLAGGAIATAALAVTFFLPAVNFNRGVPSAAGEQMIAAEMTNLEPQDEPVGISTPNSQTDP